MLKKIIFLLLILSSTGYSQEKRPIIIGSKAFSESVILGEMVALLLEEKFNHPVVRKFGLGGTKVAFDALNTGGIDIYPDYTGTGYVMILKLDGERDPDKVHEIVSTEFEKRWGIVWSDPIGFNNTYALAVRKDDPRFKKMKSISELSGKVQDFKYAGAYEFMERKDGHPRFSKSYRLNFKTNNVISMNAGLMYSAIQDKQVDMIVAYSTDGRIKAYDLKLLKDDQMFFPPYYVALIAKKDLLDKSEPLRKVYSLMAGLITEVEMTDMNDKVDRLKIDSRRVARNFLVEKGLLTGVVEDAKIQKGFWSFAISKKDYLIKLFYEHLLLSFGALFFAVLVSLPTGVLLTRYPKSGKIIFPVINTIQTVPSLALLGFLIPFMGIGMAPAMLALFLYSLLPLVRNTYSGIQGVDKAYVEASRGIGLTNFQILFKVEIPLAMPIILAGLRTAAVIVIGTATIAALIGAGGFGDPIFRGVSTVNSNLILLGAIPAALLAIAVDKVIGWSETGLVSKGIRLKNKR
ncbi:MAG: ABC transporter permease subunit [Bacteriovoracaceae bacterium]|nr:ABC transporter permease subunit [Bacteriovoracaceae bacterium]